MEVCNPYMAEQHYLFGIMFIDKPSWFSTPRDAICQEAESLSTDPAPRKPVGRCSLDVGKITHHSMKVNRWSVFSEARCVRALCDSTVACENILLPISDTLCLS